MSHWNGNYDFKQMYAFELNGATIKEVYFESEYALVLELTDGSKVRILAWDREIIVEKKRWIP